MRVPLLLAASAAAHVALLAWARPGPWFFDRLCLATVRPLLLHGPASWAAATSWPVAELIVGALGLFVLWLLAAPLIAWRRHRGVRAAARRSALACLVTVSVTLHLFLFAFGHLYFASRIEQRLPRLRAELDQDAIDTQVLALARETGRCRVAAVTRDLDDLSQRVVPLLNQRLRQLDMPEIPPLRAKAVAPRGLLLTAGVSGITAFLPPEPLVDDGVDPAILPMLVAHELAHMAGVAHEDDAEFLAWWALDAAADADLRYAGALAIAMRIARRVAATPLRAPFLEALGRDVLADARRVALRGAAFEVRVIADTSHRIQQRYLKSVGVSAGVASYDQATRLVLAELASRPVEPASQSRPQPR